MIRGSIPLFWSHEKFTISFKPDIILDYKKDKDYQISFKHFENLFSEYGEKVYVFNLVKNKTKSKETVLGTAFYKCIKEINS